MKASIIERIKALGGKTNNIKGLSLMDDLSSIEFNHPLYPDYFDEEFYGIDEFYENHLQLYKTKPHEFYKQLMLHYFSDHEIPYGQAFFRNWLFTPFKENSPTYGELDGMAEESDIRKVVEGNLLEFMCICYSYGFPDHYFVCLTDPNPENPMVYSTDHEVYFQEIEKEGTLEDFFHRFLTQDEFLSKVKNYLENDRKP